jgi:hypothetical protein
MYDILPTSDTDPKRDENALRQEEIRDEARQHRIAEEVEEAEGQRDEQDEENEGDTSDS